MKDLQEEFNRITNNKYNFKLKSGLLDSKAGILSAEVVYDDGTMLTEEDKKLCYSAAAKNMPDYKININFTKNFLSGGTIRRFLRVYLKSNYVSIKYAIKSVEQKDNVFYIFLQMAQEQQVYIKSQKILETIASALKERFMHNFALRAEYVDNMLDFSKLETDEDEIATKKQIHVDDKQVIVGHEIANDANYIRDSRTTNEQVIVCGYIRELKTLWTKPKIQDGQNAKDVIEYFKHDVPRSERIEAGQRQYFRFKLQDFTGEMQVALYPKQSDQKNLDEIVEGATIIVSGMVQEDNYFGTYLRAESLSICKLPDVWEEQIDYKKEKPFYEFVEPQDMTYTNQVGLFSMFDTPKVAPYLRDNEIVVFDFETTGLNAYEGDRIVEIGAVKVVNGAIVQSFRTLVNPEMHIPESSSAVHKIFDKDVIGAPTIEKALQDFYKFTRGAILVGYNVAFDYSFLMTQGKACRYNFDNQTYDCLELARKSIKGLKNYKLGTIAKQLGVSLENAHSALADTIATAEVFIKLADNI